MRYPKYRNTLNRHKWCTQEIENISSQVNIQMQVFVTGRFGMYYTCVSGTNDDGGADEDGIPIRILGSLC